ncbi:MAG TPA: hypothetical protein VFU22_24980 [Roseiflexaceae bacterium]|nr:hypothetical protein [Roseiflexaceae bacterium]
MSTASLILPPLETLDAAAHQLLEQATPSQERAINKALWHLQSGIEIRSTYGGFLMPSGTRAGVTHRVSTVNGCNCEAAGKGLACWHQSAIAIIEEAQRHTMPSLGQRISAARAKAQMAELFN